MRDDSLTTIWKKRKQKARYETNNAYTHVAGDLFARKLIFSGSDAANRNIMVWVCGVSRLCANYGF